MCHTFLHAHLSTLPICHHCSQQVLHCDFPGGWRWERFMNWQSTALHGCMPRCCPSLIEFSINSYISACNLLSSCGTVHSTPTAPLPCMVPCTAACCCLPVSVAQNAQSLHGMLLILFFATHPLLFNTHSTQRGCTLRSSSHLCTS